MKVRMFGLVLLLAAAAAQVQAQSVPPSAYTLQLVSNMTEASMFSGRNSTLKVYRSGAKELVELTLDPQQGKPNVKVRYLFDFAAHKAYTHDLESKSCSWMKYVSAEAPISYDPITGSSLMLSQMSSDAKPKVVGKESVNGIPTVAQEVVMPGGQGKAKLWLSEKGNYFVKLQVLGPRDKLMMNMEIQQLSFEKPQDSLFAIPANCSTQTQGEWSSTGVKASAEIQIK